MLDKAEYVQYIGTLGIASATFGGLPYIVRDNYEWIRGIREEVDITAATSETSSAAMIEMLVLEKKVWVVMRKGVLVVT